MAAIGTNQVKMGIMPGVTWGTAVAVSGAQLIHGTYNLRTSRVEWSPNGTGFDNFKTEVCKLEESVEITMTCDLAFNSVCAQPLAHILGQDTSTEQNVGEGDYQHVMKLDEENDGEFSTFAASYGTGANDVLEIPSVKWHTVTVTQSRQGIGSIAFTGIGDKVLFGTDATNALSDLDGASYPDSNSDQCAYLGGADAYFRVNAQSGGALSSSDNLQIMDYSFTIARPLVGKHVLRGANTRYSIEPKQRGNTEGSLQFTLNEIDHSAIDLPSLWANDTEQKAEVFFTGADIGSGDKRAFKFLFPRLQFSSSIPSGYDAPNNNSEMEPVANFMLLQASSAPTGMTGHTNYIGAEITNERSAAYT